MEKIQYIIFIQFYSEKMVITLAPIKMTFLGSIIVAGLLALIFLNGSPKTDSVTK
jgi:hypothetical protein